MSDIPGLDQEEFEETAHWIAAPMKDAGTSEQFHEVVRRAELALGAMSRWLDGSEVDLVDQLCKRLADLCG